MPYTSRFELPEDPTLELLVQARRPPYEPSPELDSASVASRK